MCAAAQRATEAISPAPRGLHLLVRDWQAGRNQVTPARTGQGAAKVLGYLAVAKMVAAPPSTVAVPTMNAPRESRTENREAWMAPLWPDCCPAESGR
jgi:hypothetical protein